MYREGHVGAALLVYAPLGATVFVLGFETLALVGGGVAVALAMLPDFDQRIPGIAHRGPTHTVWFALVVRALGGATGFAVGRSNGVEAIVGLTVFGFLVGFLTVCSHIAADALTPMGITPFAPLRTRHYSLDLTRAKNPVANYALLGIGVLAVVLALAVGNAIRTGLG